MDGHEQAHRWFRCTGTPDNLVVRQAESADVAAIEQVLDLVEGAGALPSGTVHDEVRTVWPTTWVVIERPRGIVGVCQLVDLPGEDADRVRLHRSPRWGKRRQEREALEIIGFEMRRDAAGELPPAWPRWRPGA